MILASHNTFSIDYVVNSFSSEIVKLVKIVHRGSQWLKVVKNNAKMVKTGKVVNFGYKVSLKISSKSKFFVW